MAAGHKQDSTASNPIGEHADTTQQGWFELDRKGTTDGDLKAKQWSTDRRLVDDSSQHGNIHTGTGSQEELTKGPQQGTEQAGPQAKTASVHPNPTGAEIASEHIVPPRQGASLTGDLQQAEDGASPEATPYDTVRSPAPLEGNNQRDPLVVDDDVNPPPVVSPSATRPEGTGRMASGPAEDDITGPPIPPTTSTTQEHQGNPAAITFPAPQTAGNTTDISASVPREQGAIQVNDNGSLTFFPTEDYQGEAILTVVSTDHNGDSATQISSVNLSKQDPNPTINIQSTTTQDQDGNHKAITFPIEGDSSNVDPTNHQVRGGKMGNTVYGGAGDDTINGGQGDDTAIFRENEAEYTIVQNNDGSLTVQDTIPDRAANDTVNNVERFSFADKTVAVEDLTLSPEDPSDTAPPNESTDGLVQEKAPHEVDTETDLAQNIPSLDLPHESEAPELPTSEDSSDLQTESDLSPNTEDTVPRQDDSPLADDDLTHSLPSISLSTLSDTPEDKEGQEHSSKEEEQEEESAPTDFTEDNEKSEPLSSADESEDHPGDSPQDDSKEVSDNNRATQDTEEELEGRELSTDDIQIPLDDAPHQVSEASDLTNEESGLERFSASSNTTSQESSSSLDDFTASDGTENSIELPTVADIDMVENDIPDQVDIDPGLNDVDAIQEDLSQEPEQIDINAMG